MSYDAAKWMFAPANNSPMGVYKELEARIVPNPTTKIVMDVSNEMAKYIEPGHTYPNVLLSKEVSDELAILKTDIDKYVAQMLAKWVVEGRIYKGGCWRSTRRDTTPTTPCSLTVLR